MTISRVLVANRGEIARRVFRTCRDLGISTVAIHSEPDAAEPHVREADQAVLLPGAAPVDTYLNIEAVLAAAKESGADAVHPGYGFLAENAIFAQKVTDAGLTWIGPSPRSMELMGSKLESKRLMRDAGVPVLAGVSLDGVTSVESAAASIGFPVLVKASAGGGGKGMRIVESPDDLRAAIDSSKRESATAFGDDTLFLEKYLSAPRHIEIQVFGDTHGRIISLFERECSIQRRHQKIIEESPSPALDENTRQAMSEAAEAAARTVDYVGAGTVEFLFQHGEFYFLEMNTRLQVEHPVTEMITGWDLVRLQILIADGEPLPEELPAMTGHAIEARVYAEDAEKDFLPVTGTIRRFRFPEIDGLRVDSGVEEGSEISVHYDPMLAKVVAHASSRHAAAELLSTSLRQAHIHGSTTNRALLVRVLEHPEFLRGETDTHFLDRNQPADLGRPLADASNERLAAVAAALADQAHARAEGSLLPDAPSGWRNMPSQLQTRSFEGVHGVYEIAYSTSETGFLVEGIGNVILKEATPWSVSLAVDQNEHRFDVARYSEERYIDSQSAPARLLAVPRFPTRQIEEDSGSLHAPMPGKILRIGALEGAEVTEGQVLIVMEAMKMEHSIRSPHDGTVAEVRCREGDQVEADAVLVVVEEG